MGHVEIPGWNVSAPLAVQVEKVKPKDPPEGRKSKKRKRNQQNQEQEQVDQQNVGDYWEKIVEGKDEKPKDATVPAEEQESKKDVDEDATDKKAKKRKRKGDKTKEAQDDAEATIEDTTSKSSKRDKKKQKKEDKSSTTESTSKPSQSTEIIPATSSSLFPEPKGLTPLQRSMRAKLTSARFRHLNESLYTKPSAESLSIFTSSPEMFEDYHRGFAQQVEVWPENPVDNYVAAISSRAKLRPDNRKGGRQSGPGGGKPQFESLASKPLPRNFKGHCTIADLGCGVASLSHRLQPSLRTLNLSIHSFDLSQPTGPTKDLVTVADISKLPLQDGSVDVAIFCLALMGTNWLDFIDEAWRILRWRGELWVSEIKSRFGRVSSSKSRSIPINSIGSLHKSTQPPKKPTKKGKGSEKVKPDEEGIQDSSDEAELASRVDGAVDNREGTDVSAFVEVLRSRGFVLDALPERPNDAIDLSNKMFVKMQFTKSAPPSKGKNVDHERLNQNNKRFDNKQGQGLRMGLKGKKFSAITTDAGDDDAGAADENDGKVLKPCLYKIR
ncbi:hypothetical protein BU24DRAFT_439479 [Aaosphaeria arxii CBS 175.79]|uniref:Ribosomal RNA-processing protein 8 n=1 Tax=Aaosphaeria arxii CBS 175.79 TaxID=1450172 RepID=A0A6A5Y2H8_9PLEO|nr:uncharacterized protein BU24DRAFT_439479 [Aaosphaeria arxii CBS 175.79]KAF2019247.1 hypothetical protein BU24DRAFT_439479 [Aaosphaeria arxii CBS 175.79]